MLKRVAMSFVLLAFATTGCGAKQDPAVRAAAEKIVSLGGSFIPSGLTVPVKVADKIPKEGFQIQKVTLNNTPTTDADLEALKPLTSLQILELQSTKISDLGLTHLSGLKSLQELDLFGCQYLTDKGLESGQPLTNLKKLELSKTALTDAAVERLTGMKHLTQLYLNNTRISAEGGKKLREGLPNCKVNGPR